MNGIDRNGKRNHAIVARAAEDPGLTLAQIGDEFNLSPGMVSLILRGLRGRGRSREISVDPELSAISQVLAIVDPLEDEQAKRALLYALKRRCGLDVTPG